MLPQNLLTGGELAKLANTTKRTVRWYVQKGIIHPNSKNEKGYQFYTPEQVIVLQTLLLLRQFGFSLREMKKFGGDKRTLGELFSQQQKFLNTEVIKITKTLRDITEYSKNISKSGTLVAPKIRSIEPMEIYYIEKEGPYNEIAKYDLELKNYFVSTPKDSVFLTIFLDNAFRPKKARLLIGIIAHPKMIIKKDAKHIVKKMTLPGFKALTYIHKSEGSFVSLLWQELIAYMHKKGIIRDSSLPFANLEIYTNTPASKLEETKNIEFELVQPIK